MFSLSFLFNSKTSKSLTWTPPSPPSFCHTVSGGASVSQLTHRRHQRRERLRRVRFGLTEMQRSHDSRLNKGQFLSATSHPLLICGDDLLKFCQSVTRLSHGVWVMEVVLVDEELSVTFTVGVMAHRSYPFEYATCERNQQNFLFNLVNMPADIRRCPRSCI